jgi:MarR family transcriptional regulator, organic hydroperoxide resistance regulator
MSTETSRDPQSPDGAQGRDDARDQHPAQSPDDAQEDDDFQEAFWGAKHALALAFAAAFSRHGVHEGQPFILRCLWAEDGLAPGEIARQLGLATSTVTRASTRMEAAGLLRREPHASDRRLVRLRLTERGRALHEVIDREMDQLTERALAGFGPADRGQVIRALREIQRNLAAG